MNHSENLQLKSKSKRKRDWIQGTKHPHEILKGKVQK